MLPNRLPAAHKPAGARVQTVLYLVGWRGGGSGGGGIIIWQDWFGTKLQCTELEVEARDVC